jgi:hypothetical protein
MTASSPTWSEAGMSLVEAGGGSFVPPMEVDRAARRRSSTRLGRWQVLPSEAGIPAQTVVN